MARTMVHVRSVLHATATQSVATPPLPPPTDDMLRRVARREEGHAEAATARGNTVIAARHAANADLAYSLLDLEQHQRAHDAALRVGSAAWVRNIMNGPAGSSVLDDPHD